MTDFVEQQANAWSEIREWAQEAERMPLVPTRPGGSWDGPGASLDCTEHLRHALPEMLEKLDVLTMLDVACGDWNWMRLVDLAQIEYTGWDVDPGRIERCQWRVTHGDFGSLERPNAQFEVMNMLTVPEIGYYDLILCRDFLGHLTNDYISTVLLKFTTSSTPWLLATTYPHATNDFVYDPNQFAWLGYMERPVNLEAPPFSLEKVGRIEEDPGPGGVLTEYRELGLFKIGEPL
jgi:hypothetical protein